ncbi:MAG: S-layer homology domain-containing protein [Anaerolineales bacterium]|nr:S-layer homology domain-containing protein [Anaerolineales bacterium]
MKKPSYFMLIFVLVIVILGGIPNQVVRANTIWTVTNANDSGSGSLRQAIIDGNSGDTILFELSLSGAIIRLDSSLLIDKGLTIDGSSLTSHIQISGDTEGDGTGDVSAFQIGGPFPVELNGLDIVKGKASGVTGGGGIANYGTLTIRNSTLSGNSYIGGLGGGGIYNKGNLTLINSTITGNMAEDGGGIFNDYGQTLTITGSTFSENVAQSISQLQGNGGGIANIGTLSVDDSMFLDNSATAGGGAIVNSINGNSILTNSSFTNNSAFGFGNGGAINNYEGQVTIENCIFTGNSDFGGVSSGGAIYNEDQMSITEGTFTGNTSSIDGGGIANLGILTVTNSVLSTNSAALGGGVINSGNLKITNTAISENVADIGGGGVFNEDNGVLTMVDSTVSNNSAPDGSGIFNITLTGVVNILSSTISENSTTGNGGGISNWGTLTATNSTLFGNSATEYGGGIINLGSLALTNVTISENSSLTSGGGIYNVGNLIYANTIIANSPVGTDCFNDSGTIGINTNNLVENNAVSPNQCGTPSLTTDPKLALPADNGGPTKTLAIGLDSPAHNGGDNSICALSSASPTFGPGGKDQRGVARPQESQCDIGAFEFDPSPNVLSSVLVNPNPTNLLSVDFTVTFSESVIGVDPGDFSLTTNSVSSAAVSGISGSGSVYTVSVNTGVGSGTLRLDVLDNDSITDLSLNPLSAGLITGETYTIRKTPIFTDVPYSYWANSYIERLYTASITGGCVLSSLQYCPDSTVTRAQMAIFLLKGIHGSSYAPPAVNGNTGFDDVAADYWAAAWIKQLAAEGITSGCGAGIYCPDSTVTRAQMAVFLLKAKNGSSYAPPAVGGSTGFNDVAVNYWAAPFINQLVTDGITSGCGAGNYCPDDSVTRAQMAVFLVRTFNLP